MSEPVKGTRAFRYRAYPTPRQEAILRTWQQAVGFTWNAALEQRKDLWSRHRAYVNRSEQSRQLSKARAEIELLRQAPAQVVNHALLRIDLAYAAAFRRIKQGEKAGFPRYASWARMGLVFPSHQQSHEVLSRESGTIRVRLTSPRGGESFGALKLRAHRSLPENAKLGQMALTCKAGRWHASITVHEEVPPGDVGDGMVGINRGLAVWAALSDGSLIEADPVYPRYAEEIVDLQQKISRSQPRSRRRQERIRQLNRVWEKASARRQQRAHELANYLLDHYDSIAIEDYDTAVMLSEADPEEPRARLRHLRRRISDAAWAEFDRILTYKAAMRGATVVKVPAPGISSECSDCGGDVEAEAATAVRSWTDRILNCPHCGERVHVDVMAARNVLDRAMVEVAL